MDAVKSMVECFCGGSLAAIDGIFVHVHSGSLWCYPDEPDVPDEAAPV